MQKLVVVSGGTKGIGLAIVKKFVDMGFMVATCSRKQENLRTVQTISENIYTFKADLSKREEVDAFGDFVLSLKIPVVCLVNNTGVFLPGKILDEPEGQLKYQLDTNLFSAYHLTRHLIHELKSQESSHIFNISSVAGIKAFPNGGSYSISKFAMQGFNKGIREELMETSVKVTAILPGATYTDSWAGTSLQKERFIQSEDIAEMVWAAFRLGKSANVEEILIRPMLGDI